MDSLCDQLCPSHVTWLEETVCIMPVYSSVSLNYPALFQHGLQITPVADDISASSCCADNFCLSSCYYCLHEQEEKSYSANCKSSRVQQCFQPYIGRTLQNKQNCIHMKEWQQWGHLWMFSQRWPAHCINVTDEGGLRKNTNVFELSNKHKKDKTYIEFNTKYYRNIASMKSEIVTIDEQTKQKYL